MRIINKSSGAMKIEAMVQLSSITFEQDPMRGVELAYHAANECPKLGNDTISEKAYLNLGILLQKTTSYSASLVYYKKSLEINKSNKGIVRTLDNIGILYREMSKYDSALIYHKQALKYSETTGDVKGKAQSFNSMGNVYIRKGDILLAIDYYKQALKIRVDNKFHDDIAASYENLGDAYKKINDYDKAHEYLFESLRMRQNQDDKEKEAACLNLIGNFYMQMKIYDKAREYYSKSLEIRSKTGNNASISAVYNNIGTLHREVGNLDKALEYYQKALELRKQHGNKEAIATSFNSIGSLYWNRKDYPRAIEYYKLALEIRRELGDASQVAATLKNLGIIYKDKNEYDKALDFYQQALDIYLKINDFNGLANIQNLKGNLFKKNQEFEKSIEFYLNSFEIYKEYNMRKEQASVANNLGEAYLLNKQTAQSIQYYTSAMRLSREVKDKEWAKISALGLSEAHKRAGNSSKALEYYTIYSSYKDSIQNDVNRKRIAEIEFESTIKMKDSQITSQQQKIGEKEAKIKQQLMFIAGIVIIGVLVLIFSVVVFVQFTQKKKAFKLLAEKGEQLEQANALLGEKNKELGIKNDQITDSITYAKRIQEAILPTDETLGLVFPVHFVFYRPKEIVSGDFYWLSQQNNCTYIAVVDCTGHGVPGAFMSMIGNAFLNEIVNERKIQDTAEILNKLDEAIIEALKQDTSADKRQEDGMDISLCKIDKATNTIEYSAANHKLLVIRDGRIEVLDGDGFPIGGMVKIKQRKNAQRTSSTISIEKGMRLYMHSDGFIDQFGGPDNQRFKTTRFHEMLLEIQKHDIHEQYMELSRRFDEWKGNRRQLDDVLVMGIEF